MELTEKEISQIKKAEAAIKRIRYARAVLLIIMLISIYAMFVDILSPDFVAYFSWGLAIFAIFLPGLSRPSYEELVALLHSIRLKENSQISNDPIIKALSGKPLK